MAQFILKINLGNIGMSTGVHVAQALKDVATILNEKGDCWKIEHLDGSIRDKNGNTVGSWQVK